MARRKIRWTQTANSQLIGILNYWINRNKSNKYSKKLFKQVLNKTSEIAEQPNLWRKSEFHETRVASLGNYSLYFKTEPNVIIIIAIWVNRQDPKKLLQMMKNQK